MDCLRYDPNLRPTIDQALFTIRNLPLGRDAFDGMETAPVDPHLGRDNNVNKLQVSPERQHDRYRVGMAGAMLPALR